jgi:hypothetical protein
VLPDLAAESIEAADRLVQLSAEKGLDAAEAEYLLVSGLAAINRIPRLWPIVRSRIAAGTTGALAQELLKRLLEALERNLALAGVLKEPARVVREEQEQESEATAGLAAVEEGLLEIRAEAANLLRVVVAPGRWPGEEQLKTAKVEMEGGNRLTANEFRRSLLDE